MYRDLLCQARSSDNIVLHAGVMPWPLASVTSKDSGVKLAKSRQYISQDDTCEESKVFKSLIPDCPE